MIDTAGIWSFTYDLILIIDTTLNKGCVHARDDYFSINNFYNTSSNIIHNDMNIDFKNARTKVYTDFMHGITLLDSFGNLNWIPDSAYTGCDTMQYVIYDSKNTSCSDTGFVIICYEDISSFCNDASVIDTSMDCNFGYMPVCGCDNKEYDNACYAYYTGGVNYYFNGPCSNLPPNLKLNGSSSLKSFDIYNDQASEMQINASDPNLGNTTALSAKLANQFNSCLKTTLSDGKLICYPTLGCTGNYTLYLSACDNWGYCNIDTIKINVLNKSTSGVKLNKGEGLKVFPNPTSSQLNLTFSDFNQGDYLKITDITGKQVANSIEILSKNEILNMEQFKTGLYYIHHLTSKGELVNIVKVSKI